MTNELVEHRSFPPREQERAVLRGYCDLCRALRGLIRAIPGIAQCHRVSARIQAAHVEERCRVAVTTSRGYRTNCSCDRSVAANPDP
jgi:hypothetical protein